jgi:uncharacterized protein (DUF488 family)
MPIIYTIGHSNREMSQLATMLRCYSIDAVADVRSSPFSKIHPQFNRDVLAASLALAKVEYVYLGKELGGRSSDRNCYVNGQVSYVRLAQTDAFKRGLERVRSGARKGYTIALLCAERDPLCCHRGLLISRQLCADGERVSHILDQQQIETHDESVTRLLEMTDLQSRHMFKSDAQVIDMAYDIQSIRVAYTQDAEMTGEPD